MKVISIWQPYATLIVHGFKFFETRTWAPPKSLIGQRIGIASTKTITPAQRAEYNDPEFQKFYTELNLPELEDLPRGYLLGTVLVHSFELIDEELLADVTEEEKRYGWFDVGGYAWRLRSPEMLEHPIPIQGRQGIYEWKGLDNAAPKEAETN